MAQRVESIPAYSAQFPSTQAAVREFGQSLVGENLLYRFAERGIDVQTDPRFQPNGDGDITALLGQELRAFSTVTDAPVVLPGSMKRVGNAVLEDSRRRKQLTPGRSRVSRENSIFTEREGVSRVRFGALAWRERINGLSYDWMNGEMQEAFVSSEIARIGAMSEHRGFFEFTLNELRERRDQPGFATEVFGSSVLEVNGVRRPLEVYTAPQSIYDGDAPNSLSVLYVYLPHRTAHSAVLLGFFERGREGEHLGEMLASLYKPS